MRLRIQRPVLDDDLVRLLSFLHFPFENISNHQAFHGKFNYCFSARNHRRVVGTRLGALLNLCVVAEQSKQARERYFTRKLHVASDTTASYRQFYFFAFVLLFKLSVKQLYNAAINFTFYKFDRERPTMSPARGSGVRAELKGSAEASLRRLWRAEIEAGPVQF